MRVCTIGTGYVGLVTAAALAESGNHVNAIDSDAARIARLQNGGLPLYEPGLEELVVSNVLRRRLEFSTDLRAAVADAEVVFVAVGTPARLDGSADLAAVDSVADTVAAAATRELVLVLKSTVPVGTNARVRRCVEGAAHRVHVVSNPEFLREGEAVQDFLRPDRIVLGCEDGDHFARDVLERLYHPYCLDRNRTLWMDPRSAELTKYVANTMLAMRISLMNEVAALCERVEADVHHVRLGVGADERIGAKFLYAGPGYGGSCFSKDVQALVHIGAEHGLELELASATERVNHRQRGVVLQKLEQHFGGDLRGKRVLVWGVAFKPKTDDVREAPSLTLIEGLLAAGATVVAHDPKAGAEVARRFGARVLVVDDAYEGAEGADALALMTEWREYQNPDFDELARRMRRPLVIDARNIWSGYGLRRRGFEYDGIGVRGS